jgi:NADPH-dependent curcumin reductase CurA
MPGLTAYVGLLDIGNPKSGETVFVSGAAGAVGSVVCQIARLKGCRVVGTAGSTEKVNWLTKEAGVDVALNYKTTDNLHAALREACPNGVDIYFDNVGGDHLEAALALMNDHGRIVACGAISAYNATEPPSGPRNLFQIITRRLLWQGLIVTDHFGRFPAFVEDAAAWIADGSLGYRETVYEGIENAPAAFLGLFSGENLGKMLVRLHTE